MKYVVSEDLEFVLEQLTATCGFASPPEKSIAQLRNALKQKLQTIFGSAVEMVTAISMRDGIEAALTQVPATPVSLDRLYVKCAHHIDMTRSVNMALCGCGETERCGSAPLSVQVQALAAQGINDITLIDDVIFSGNGIMRLTELCMTHGIAVRAVVVGIAIGEGEQKIAAHGIPVRAVYRYLRVIDEICERDFYAGLPLSGRNVTEPTRNIGAPYFLPFGKPCEWASVPAEHVETFSQFCIQQNIKLWRAIEVASNTTIQCGDLPRLPFGAPCNGKPFVSYLESLLR